MAVNHPKLTSVGLKSCFGVSMAISGGFEIVWLWQGAGVVFLENPMANLPDEGCR